MEKLNLRLPGFMGNLDVVVTYYNSHLNKYIASWKVIPKYTPPRKLTKKSLLLPNALRLESYLNDCRKYIF